MYKVVPPSKWKARKVPIEQVFDQLVVNSPIEQNVQGKSGVYELLLIQKKSLKLNEYIKKVKPFDKNTDNKSIEEVEQLFWKNIAFSPPLYGADMGGSAFDHETPWNMNDLPGVLKEGLKVHVAGVNKPYLYVGSWKTLFGWHCEDLDLNAINFVHYGKPKFWYSLPPSERPKLEAFAKQYFPDGFNKCKEFMRHKTTMINPYLLKQKIPDLKIHKMIQYPGEFICLHPGAYHAGFNWGFNVAEAVNYAVQRCVEFLPKVGICKCVGDSVKIKPSEFYKELLKSPIYSKNAHIKKVCNDYFAEHESEESEASTFDETEVSEEAKPKKAKKTQQQPKRKYNKSTNSQTKKVLKTKPKRVLMKEKKKEEKEEESKVEHSCDEGATRVSGRTKKIRKLGDDFEVQDWRKPYKSTNRPKKSSKSEHKMSREEAEKLFRERSYDQLEITNWLQCDDCNKWRLLNVDDSKRR
mmetsp:Transcript_28652/g.25620  ORF Transcript_28652/g.25620 Transcript_28652/m.25620 type:complete len:466 (+) Transcript_28652:232-1629(+)